MYELCGCFQKWQHALFSLCVQLFEIFTLTNLWCLCKYFLPKEIVFNLLNIANLTTKHTTFDCLVTAWSGGRECWWECGLCLFSSLMKDFILIIAFEQIENNFRLSSTPFCNRVGWSMTQNIQIGWRGWLEVGLRGTKGQSTLAAGCSSCFCSLLLLLPIQAIQAAAASAAAADTFGLENKELSRQILLKKLISSMNSRLLMKKPGQLQFAPPLQLLKLQQQPPDAELYSWKAILEPYILNCSSWEIQQPLG